MSHENDASGQRRRHFFRKRGHTHSFDVQVAVHHGFAAAILYARLSFWLAENSEAGRNLDEEGRPWSYDSCQAMGRHMPYLNVRHIQRALQLLKDANLIITKKDPNPWNKRLWYSLPDEAWILEEERAPIDEEEGEYEPEPMSQRCDKFGTSKRQGCRINEPPVSHDHTVKDTLIDFNLEPNTPASRDAGYRRQKESRTGDKSKIYQNTPKVDATKSDSQNDHSHQKRQKSSPRPVSVSPSRIERAPLVFTSEDEHAKLIKKHGLELTNRAYQELSDWKSSKCETDPKAVDAHIDYYRLVRWGINTAKDLKAGVRPGFQRLGHCAGDEQAQNDAHLPPVTDAELRASFAKKSAANPEKAKRIADILAAQQPKGLS
jgi:hypothetical protein